MSTADFAAQLLAGFAEALEPLIEAGSSTDGLAAFVADLGWSLDPGLQSVPTEFAAVVSSAADLLSQLPDLQSGDETKVAAAIATAIKDAQTMAQQLAALSAANGLPPALQDPQLPAKALSLLVYRYLESYHPRLFALLRLIGVLDEIVHNQASAPAVPYIERKLDLSRLGQAFSDPASIGSNVYGWGSSFDAEALLTALERAASGLALGVTDDVDTGLGLYYDATSILSQRSLVIPVWTGTIAAGGTLASGEIDLVVLPIPAAGQQAGPADGLAFFPSLTGQLGVTMDLGPGVTLSVTGQLDATGAVRAEVRPSGARLVAPGGETVSAGIRIDAKPDTPYVVIGARSGGRLEIAQAHAGLSASASPADAELRIEIAADQAALVIDLGQGDGFLKTAIGGEPQRLTFALAASWSTSGGFAFAGSAKPQLDLPVHINVAGVLAVNALHIGLSSGAAAGEVAIEVSATGGLALGPVTATIQRFGVLLEIGQRPGHDGNLGDLNLGFGFKAPDGASLGLQAPPVTGVGFLAFDTAAGRYLGAIALQVGDVAISAVGVLDTKVPAGGYSLIVVASAQFPPIQLGFGFSLSAIGGLVGVNRTADVPSLQALARAGRLDDLMFPADLIHRAPQVAANLAQQFPVAQGHFIVGPSVQIQWGTGGLVYADIGVFIELTDSGGGITVLRIALLGLVHLTLPDGAAPVADITLDVLGVLDFAAKTLSLDAGLRNSTIATFPLTGQAALRAGWGASPEFLFAIGGFNPCFQAPTGFPALQRIALSIGGDNPRLRLSAYLALTSNTLQLGCAADLYASTNVAGVTAAVAASLTFDALVQFKPFGLIIDLTISAAILINNNPVMSLNLDLHVTGPDPWTVTGSASFHFLFAGITVPISITAGSAPPPQPPQTVDLDGNLLTALADPRSWATGPPAGRSLVRVHSQGTAGNAVHPLGSLTVRQHSVPLGQRVECYGPDLLEAPCQYDITGTSLGAQPVSGTAVADYFAPAQFRTMSDQDKLSAPSFESMTAGATLGSAGLSLTPIPAQGQPPPPVVDSVPAVSWTILKLDSPDPAPSAAQAAPDGQPPAATPDTVSVPDQLLAAQLGGAAAARSGPAGQPEAVYASPGIGIAVQDPYYAITGLDLGVPDRSDLTSLTAGLTAAAQAGYKRDWQIVYASEVG
jgi:hypothetical protein